MPQSSTRNKIRNWIEATAILFFCGAAVLLGAKEFSILSNDRRNEMLLKIMQQFVGSLAAILLMRRLNVRLFGRVQNWLYLIPCLVVAVDNFQFSAYFNGRMQRIHADFIDLLLFSVSCLLVGLFEELVFRGVIFSLLAEVFSKNRRGFLYTYVFSSVIFGLAHLLNGFSGATFLQVGYSILTGGLFAFCLIKTKNILCCALVHAVYNFCGTLFAESGLGTGVIFDLGTIITMSVVCVSVGIFVLYKVWTYTEEERKTLYGRLGIVLK